MKMTKHASMRAQQRAIPPQIIDWLGEHGFRRHDKHGAVIYYFNNKIRRKLAECYGCDQVEKLGNKLNAYLVASGDEIITVGYRQKRIKLH